MRLHAPLRTRLFKFLADTIPSRRVALTFLRVNETNFALSSEIIADSTLSLAMEEDDKFFGFIRGNSGNGDSNRSTF